MLCDLPHIGTLNDRIDPPIRSIAHRRHRIYYDVEGDTVLIRRVLHSARDARPLLS